MDVENINPFILAAKSVLKTLCGTETSLGKVYLKDSHFLVDQLMVVFGVVGKLRGQVYFELSKESAMKIASAMMGGVHVDDLDEISKSAICEMGNMIMGKTCTLLGEKSINVDITPPSLMSGHGIEISNKLQTIGIPLSIDGHGVITINIFME